MESLAKNRIAPWLGWLGLALVAAGAPHYAWSVFQPLWGLYAAGLGLACLLAAALLGRRELARFLTSRSARLGLGAGASLLMVLAIVLLLGSLAGRHHLRLDLTRDSRHTLAPQSRELVAKLGQPVKAYAFFREGQPGRETARDLLEQYAFINRQFTYQFVDPDREPGLARRFEVRSYGSLLLTMGERIERCKLPEEQDITSALLRLTRSGQKTVYLLSGHGEPSLQDATPGGLALFGKDLEKQNYQAKPLVLLSTPQVPEDAALLVLAAPKKPLAANEIKTLDQFLARGGALLLLLEPDRPSGLEDWLKERGVLLDNDLILDPSSSLVGASPAWPIVVEYPAHPITRPLEGLVCYFPTARSLQLAKALPAGSRGAEILKTSPTAWGATDFEALKSGQAKFQPERDLKGPLVLGLVLEMAPAAEVQGQAPPRAGRLAVIGDADFMTNQHVNQAGNMDLALNLVAYLAEEMEVPGLRPRPVASQPLLLTPGQGIFIFGLPVVVLPLIFLTLGIVVVRRRRRPA